jgi:GT2 family glycosyltransferase
MIKLSIIVVTTGRPSLYETISSVYTAGLASTDELIVVADGPSSEARDIVGVHQKRHRNLIYKELPERRGGFGGIQRTFAMSIATGTHVLCMDDDDAYRAGAFQRVREEIAKNPSRILIFKMVAVAKRHAWNEVWHTPNSLGHGNVGTPTFCVPRKPELIPPWPPEYSGDFEFIYKAAQNFGGPGELIWVDHIIAEIY